MPNIMIDNIQVSVDEGSTILDAAGKAGIKIPTLCYLKGVQAIGACRMCVVEVAGARNLAASCVTPVTEGMVVTTNNMRVRNARRTVMELLLSEHAGDCLVCPRSDDCELRRLAEELGVKMIRYAGEKHVRTIDDSTPALVREPGKCIGCRRCVTVCSEIQGVCALFPQSRGFKTTIGPAFDHPLNDMVCVQCGQCAAVCPVGAITEKNRIDDVFAALNDPEKHVVVQTAPAIRAALGECFGYPPGTLVTGKMVSALKRLGFDAVFDTNFAADLTIMEESMELLARLRKNFDGEKDSPIPMFTSCCPAWVKFLEHKHPDLLANLSTCKSPQQMFGAVAKSYYAKRIGKRREDIVVVSVMPCTAKKYESTRSEMSSDQIPDVDIVITTRELAGMIKQSGIDFTCLVDGKMDNLLGMSTGAADIFANTGGVMEAALRTAYEVITGNKFPFEDLHVREIAGLKGLKHAELTITGTVPEWEFLEGKILKVAVAHGLVNAGKLIEKILSREADYHFIEVMACPGGCIGGGGQPRFTTDDVRKARIKAIYKEDEGKMLRKSHENPEIVQLYNEFLKAPLSEISHHLLHTHYKDRTCGK